MSNRNLFQQYLNSRNFSFETISVILDSLNGILIKQIDALHSNSVKIDYWQHPLEALSFKLSSHIASFRKLLEKISLPFGGIRIEMYDISSINIICRAIIENYLTLYHFHFDTIAKEQKEFRFLIYAISALKNRQLFTPNTDESILQRNKDKIEIEKFKKGLEDNTYFKSLPLERREHYLNSKQAKQLSWVDLLGTSNLKPEVFKDVWRLQSNYAHSEFLSILQLRDFPKNPAQLISSCYVMAEVSAMILAITITELAKLFPGIKEITEELESDEKNFLQYFTLVGTKVQE